MIEEREGWTILLFRYALPWTCQSSKRMKWKINLLCLRCFACSPRKLGLTASPLYSALPLPIFPIYYWTVNSWTWTSTTISFSTELLHARTFFLSFTRSSKLFDSLFSVLDQSLRTLFIQRRIFLLSKLSRNSSLFVRLNPLLVPFEFIKGSVIVNLSLFIPYFCRSSC